MRKPTTPLSNNTLEGTAKSDQGKTTFKFSYSASFVELLQSMSATLFLSTYQAGKVLLVRAHDGRISIILRSYDKAMGLAVEKDRLAIATRFKIWVLKNSPETAAQLMPRGLHDSCFLPRISYVTSAIDTHEVAWGRDGLVIVNTLFSCLCTLDENYSFVPRSMA